jgi:hypothetical protein
MSTFTTPDLGETHPTRTSFIVPSVEFGVTHDPGLSNAGKSIGLLKHSTTGEIFLLGANVANFIAKSPDDGLTWSLVRDTTNDDPETTFSEIGQSLFELPTGDMVYPADNFKTANDPPLGIQARGASRIFPTDAGPSDVPDKNEILSRFDTIRTVDPSGFCYAARGGLITVANNGGVAPVIVSENPVTSGS